MFSLYFVYVPLCVGSQTEEACSRMGLMNALYALSSMGVTLVLRLASGILGSCLLWSICC